MIRSCNSVNSICSGSLPNRAFRVHRVTVAGRAGTTSKAATMKIIIGSKIGRWTVIDLLPKYEARCRCECGTVRIVFIGSLVSNRSKSCGCLRVETTRARSLVHGESSGRKHSAEYSSWAGMRERCLNPNNGRFSYYGGRGIKVCKRWDSFNLFVEDMGRKPSKNHSVERINNNGNYEPSNCRWATKLEQCENQRSNRLVTFGGETKTISQWSRLTNINYYTILGRINKGWSSEKSLTKKP